MADENINQTKIPAKDGHLIQTLSLGFDEADKKAVIIISHGFSERAESYIEIAKELCQAGFSCLIPNQRGHGEPPEGSGKWHGIIQSYQSFIDDIEVITETAKKLSPNLPIVLYGHSMGGGIVLNTLLHMPKEKQSQYICTIIEAPWLGLHKELGGFARSLLSVLGRIAPNIRIKRKPNTENLSSNAERARGITEDEFYHGYLSFHMLNEIMDSCEYAMKKAQNLAIPTFLAVAEKEAVVNNDKMHEFAKKAGEIVKLKEYDSFHAIHNDNKRDAFCEDMVEFINSHLNRL